MGVVYGCRKININGKRYIEYIETLNGQEYCIFKEKIIIVQEYIDGYVIENNSGDYSKVIQSARLLGKMVKALKEYDEWPKENSINNTFSKQALCNSIYKMEKQYNELRINKKYNEILKDIQDKIKIGENFIENFDFEILDKLSILGTHGDYNVQQLIYSDNNVTVIDFETAKKLPIIWEIMRSYSYIDIKAKDGNLDINNMIDYFYEFNKYVKLNYYDLKYAPHIYLMQLVGSMFGYREYIKNNSQKDLLEFAIFRTNLSRYLYKNADEIGEKLVIGIKEKEELER